MKRKPKKITKSRSPFEPELIVAHLLGGTSGLNFQQQRSPEEIKNLVKQAVDVMREIQLQCSEKI
jgi:hypothetical protein